MSTATLRMGFDSMSHWNNSPFSKEQIRHSVPTLKRKSPSPIPTHTSMSCERPDSPISPAPLSNRVPTFAEARSNWSPPPSPRTRSLRTASPVERKDSGISTPTLTPDDQKALSRNLYSAACAGDVKHLRLLLSLGAPVNVPVFVDGLFDQFAPAKPGMLSALAGAAANGQLAAARVLISHGAAINPTAKQSSSSPLHQALRADDYQMAAFLLKHAADVDAYDAFRTTPLILAAKSASASLVALLLKFGPDVNKVSFIGTTAIHAAIWRGNEEVLGLLLQAGAFPESTLGPLHCAAQTNQARIAIMLLQYGANVLKRNEEYKTPRQIASEMGNYEVALVLAEAEKMMR